MNKMDFLQFLKYRGPEIFKLTGEHIKITGVAVLLAIIVGVPLGIYITKNKKITRYTLYMKIKYRTQMEMSLKEIFLSWLHLMRVLTVIVFYLSFNK